MRADGLRSRERTIKFPPGSRQPQILGLVISQLRSYSSPSPSRFSKDLSHPPLSVLTLIAFPRDYTSSVAYRTLVFLSLCPHSSRKKRGFVLRNLQQDTTFKYFRFNYNGTYPDSSRCSDISIKPWLPVRGREVPVVKYKVRQSQTHLRVFRPQTTVEASQFRRGPEPGQL